MKPTIQNPVPFSDVQEQLIGKSPGCRLIVNAGPGTGKTEIACARVAFLIAEQNVAAHNILIISFTRTAVKEIRDRLVRAVGAKADVVRIATLDSHAFQLVQGFSTSDEKKLFSGYDRTIENALELLESESAEVAEFLSEMQHLVVDEAQDVVGLRGRFVLALVRAMPMTAGVTLLTDDAQAIYGFSLEENEGLKAIETITLPWLIRKEVTPAFEEAHLTKVHRTESASLLKIFSDTRKLVLDESVPGPRRLTLVREDIERLADGKIGDLDPKLLKGQDDLLMLFRRRAEVLTASSLLSSEGIAHRIRMPGTPANVHAWLGIVFHDFEGHLISRPEFLDRWTRVEIDARGSATADTWWEILTRNAGKSDDVVDVHVLRRLLARSRPPIVFVAPEAGQSGPILGTIHSSKGREAKQVELRIPHGYSEEGDLSEEARVLFVGATRAKKALRVGKGFWLQSSSLKNGSGRVFRSLPDGGVMVEFGREMDFDPAGQAGRSLFGMMSVLESQMRLRSMVGKITSISGTSTALPTEDGKQYMYRLVTKDDKKVVGHFSSRVDKDLYAIGKELHLDKVKPPKEIRHLYSIDVRTVAFAPDDPVLSSLLSPFNRSGMMLAPVVVSFPKIYVGWKNKPS